MPATAQTCPLWDKQCNLNRQCDPTDFACMALKDEELYSFLVGSYCRDPPKCSQKGYLPSELLFEALKACSQESGGDPERFHACVLDLRDILVESVNRVREVVRR